MMAQSIEEDDMAQDQAGPNDLKLEEFEEFIEADELEALRAERDELRDYYLDMSNLQGTDERDVERLLTSFWTRMQGGEEKQAALELFELANERTLDLPRIKLRYRQMVSEHHPDRGGSTERLQSINLAMEILERYYR
mgnify:CR=1 FL=1